MNLYNLKSKCDNMRNLCKINKNRIVEKMCVCDKDVCVLLAQFNNRLTCMEKLCELLCCCCCELEHVSKHLLLEYNDKCKELHDLVCKINKHENISKENKKYIRCNDFLKLCKEKIHSSNKKSKKK